MKKILFATTALIATASIASAEVNVGGTARLGVQHLSTDSVAATGTVAAIAAATAASTAANAVAAASAAAYAAAAAAGAATAVMAATADADAANAAGMAAALDAIDGTASTSTTSLESRVSVNIDFSTETDGGLELGGRIRLRADENALTVANGAQLYVKSGGFKLTVGNICGALECMPGMYSHSVGLNGNGYDNLAINTRGAGNWGWDAYASNNVGANGVEVEYTAGDFKAHLSYGNLNPAGFHRTALTLAYTFGDWTAALGLQEGDRLGGVDDKTVITVNGKLGDFGIGFAAADNNGTNKYVLKADYTMGATTIGAFIASEDTVTVDNSYGLNVAYDLGGATLVGGIAKVGQLGNRSDTRASAGIKFSF